MLPQPALASPLLPPSPSVLSIDDLLRTFVGEFGPAQLLHFTLVSLAWSLEALQTLVMVFADRTPSWTCSRSPSLAALLPSDMSRSDPCSSASSICSLDPALWEWVGGQSQSTVSEWGLLCGQTYKVGLVQSAFFFGALIGAGVFGSLSDSFLGRKGVLALVCALNAMCGFLTAFSPSYWVYLVLRGATGFSCGGVGLSSFVLATEPVGPSKRGSVGMSAFYFFSSGIVLLSVLAYFSPSWQYLYLITSAPALLYCLFVLPFVSESPRWYLVKGRTDEALCVLKSLAKKNGRVIPAGISIDTELPDPQIESQVTLPNQVEGLPSKIDISQETIQAVSGTLLDVFRISATRTNMIIMVFVWLDVAVVYYGISLNVTNLGTNLYLSVFLNAIAEMPAFALTASLLHKFGRRYMLIFTMLLTAACSIIGTFISIKSENVSFASEVRLICGVMGIFGLAGAYNLLYIYTAELFPTIVRNAALGLASQAAQVGAIVAPMIAVLGKVQPSFPFAIFSTASTLGFLLALKLPETLNKPMYETLEGMQRGEEINLLHGR